MIAMPNNSRNYYKNICHMLLKFDNSVTYTGTGTLIK